MVAIPPNMGEKAMQAVQAYRPQPVGGDTRTAAPTKADLIYSGLKQIFDAEAQANIERLKQGQRLQSGPAVLDLPICETGSTVLKCIIQVRKSSFLRFANSNIDTQIAEIEKKGKKAAFTDLHSEVVMKVQRADVLAGIIFRCEPECNNNLFNSKILKSLTVAAM